MLGSKLGLGVSTDLYKHKCLSVDSFILLKVFEIYKDKKLLGQVKISTSGKKF